PSLASTLFPYTTLFRSDLLALLLEGRCGMPDRRRILAGFATSAIAAVVSRQAWAAASIQIDDASALLVIDVQNCFLPGGSLAVKDRKSTRLNSSHEWIS